MRQSGVGEGPESDSLLPLTLHRISGLSLWTCVKEPHWGRVLDLIHISQGELRVKYENTPEFQKYVLYLRHNRPTVVLVQIYLGYTLLAEYDTGVEWI